LERVHRTIALQAASKPLDAMAKGELCKSRKKAHSPVIIGS
jgi:hypothetical protein